MAARNISTLCSLAVSPNINPRLTTMRISQSFCSSSWSGVVHTLLCNVGKSLLFPKGFGADKRRHAQPSIPQVEVPSNNHSVSGCSMRGDRNPNLTQAYIFSPPCARTHRAWDGNHAALICAPAHIQFGHFKKHKGKKQRTNTGLVLGEAG